MLIDKITNNLPFDIYRISFYTNNNINNVNEDEINKYYNINNIKLNINNKDKDNNKDNNKIQNNKSKINIHFLNYLLL